MLPFQGITGDDPVIAVIRMKVPLAKVTPSTTEIYLLFSTTADPRCGIYSSRNLMLRRSHFLRRYGERPCDFITIMFDVFHRVCVYYGELMLKAKGHSG